MRVKVQEGGDGDGDLGLEDLFDELGLAESLDDFAEDAAAYRLLWSGTCRTLDVLGLHAVGEHEHHLAPHVEVEEPRSQVKPSTHSVLNITAVSK